MSNLEQMIQGIHKEAEQEAQQLRAEAKAQAERDIQVQVEAATEEAKRRVARAEADVERIQDRVRTGAERTMRDQLLSEKQRLIDRVFELAKKRLCDLPEDAYRAMLDRFFANHPVSNEAVLELPKGRTYRPPIAVPVRESDRLRSGFQLVESGIRINGDLEVLADTLREELEPVVADLLSQ